MSAPARPWSGRRLHFVGVGGAGMSGYARAAHALGAERQRLRRARAAPTCGAWPTTACSTRSVGHAAENVPPGEDVEVVYSSARAARRTPSASRRASAACRERPRAELLGELSALRRTIAVAGHARQDDDLGDARARAARARVWTRAG